MIVELDDARRRRAGDVVLDEIAREIERKTGKPVATVAVMPPADPRFVNDDSGYDPRVPEGRYEAEFVSHSSKPESIHGRRIWVIRWRLVDDYVPGNPYVGIELRQFLSALPEPVKQDDGSLAYARPRPGWALVQAYGNATGERPPRNLASIQPRRFLRGRFVVRVRDVKKDSKGIERPAGTIYSRVDAIVKPAVV